MFTFERGAPSDAQCVLGMTQVRLGPVAVLAMLAMLAMRDNPTGGCRSTNFIWRATG